MIIIRSPLLHRLFGPRPAAGKPGQLRLAFGDASASPPPSGRDAIVTDYANAIGRMSAENRGNPIWWATDLASRNRFASPLATLLNDLIRFRMSDTQAQADDAELVLDEPPWPLVQAVKALARSRGMKVRVFAWPGGRWIARLQGEIRAWTSLLKGAVFALAQVRATKKIYGAAPEINAPVFLIKSFVYAGDFDDTGRHHDAFFGRYPEYAASVLNPGTEILTVVQGFEQKQDCYRRMRQTADKRVVPIEAYLSPGDVFAGFCRCLAAVLGKRISVPDRLEIKGIDAAPMIREAVASGGWQIAFFQYLHETAAINLSRSHQLRGCALTFEGNPWERMFIRGLRQADPALPVYGFQHSVAPQAAAGVFLSTYETDCTPGPDAILTTGDIPAKIIARYGAYGSTPILPVGALRYEHMTETLPATRRESGALTIILVALEGVFPAAALLDYAVKQARALPEIRFRIRAHPVLPLGDLLNELGLSAPMLPANVEESRDLSVRHDVENCDAVLYWGSTIALESILIGRPIIHFDRGDALSYDPLFELGAFRWSVRVDSDLNVPMENIMQMPDAEFGLQRENAIKYIKEYFLPVSDSVMSKTLPEPPAHTPSAEPQTI